MPKLRSDDDDSERQTEKGTLNVDLKTDDSSERRNREVMMMTLKVKLRSDNGSERRNRGCDSECHKP